jgi:LPXTG-motif cell wall-anchored protein
MAITDSKAGDHQMDGKSFSALILILIGLGGLWYGVTNIGSGTANSLNVQHADYPPDGQSISIPIWGGIGAMLVGGLIWSTRRKKIEAE